MQFLYKNFYPRIIEKLQNIILIIYFYDTYIKIYASTACSIRKKKNRQYVNAVIQYAFILDKNNYQWYNFAFASIDTIDGNTSTERIGIAAMPVEGMINYYGTVMTTNYQ